MKVMATIARGVVATTLMAAAFAAGAPGAAHAARSDCERGANGFVDISERQSGATKGTVELRPWAANKGWVHLAVAKINGQQRGFAAIVGQEPGDEFWMDWTTNNGGSWVQCGPFVAPDHHPHTTAAKETNSSPNWRFRACGSRWDSNDVVCTGWW